MVITIRIYMIAITKEKKERKLISLITNKERKEKPPVEKQIFPSRFTLLKAV